MNPIKLFEVFGYVNLDGKEYCVLYAKDGDQFFMKENNGELEYITIEEYIKLLDRFSKSRLLYSEKRYYKVTYNNTKPKKEKLTKRVLTSKSVWKGTSLISLTLALVLAFGKPVKSLIASNIFDNNITFENLNEYGLTTQNYYNQDTYLALIDSIDQSQFPEYSNIITSENFSDDYKLVNKDEFCDILGLEPVSYDELYETIKNLEVNKRFKSLLTSVVASYQKVDPNLDLRLIKYNLQRCKFGSISHNYRGLVEYGEVSAFCFDVMDGVFTFQDIFNNTPESAIIDDLMHDFEHLNDCAYDANAKIRCTSYVDAINGGADTKPVINRSFGLSLEEFKAEYARSQYIDGKMALHVEKSRSNCLVFYYILENLYGMQNIRNMNIIEINKELANQGMDNTRLLEGILVLDALTEIDNTTNAYLDEAGLDQLWECMINLIADRIVFMKNNNVSLEDAREIIEAFFAGIEDKYNTRVCNDFKKYYSNAKNFILQRFDEIFYENINEESESYSVERTAKKLT